MNKLDIFLIKNSTILNALSDDPWEILGQTDSMDYAGSYVTFFGLYKAFKLLVMCLCIFSILGSVVLTIYANLMGNSKDIEASKKNIMDKLFTITIVSGLLTILTWIKALIDSFYGL